MLISDSMDGLGIFLGVLNLLAIFGLALLFFSQRKSAQAPDQSLVLLQQQLHSFQDRLDKFGESVSDNLRQSSNAMNARLENTTKVVGDLREQVGQIHEVGKAAAELVNILRAPKLRGGIGELFLGELLTQMLPSEHFKLQHRFRSGETVDAVITIGEKLVPVDSKFPLENFKRVLEAPTDTERISAKKQFLRDVKKHVDAIATKYIRPDEGTYDFALMYIPAENVYYETVIKENDTAGEREILGYGLEHKVIPVSPNSFYAYLHTILLGLRGMQVEERAGEILSTLAGLRVDFDKLQESLRILGRHLTNAQGSFAESEKNYAKLDTKITQLEQPKSDRQTSLAKH